MADLAAEAQAQLAALAREAAATTRGDLAEVADALLAALQARLAAEPPWAQSALVDLCARGARQFCALVGVPPNDQPTGRTRSPARWAGRTRHTCC